MSTLCTVGRDDHYGQLIQSAPVLYHTEGELLFARIRALSQFAHQRQGGFLHDSQLVGPHGLSFEQAFVEQTVVQVLLVRTEVPDWLCSFASNRHGFWIITPEVLETIRTFIEDGDFDNLISNP